MRYLLPFLLVFGLFSCNDPAAVNTDEPRDPLIDSAEKYNMLFQQEKNVDPAMASVYADLGLAYGLEGDYDQGTADGYANVGYVHCVRQEFAEGLVSLQMAIDHYRAFNDSSGIANCNSTIGTIYLSSQKYDTALIFETQALVLHQKLNMHKQVSSDMNSISLVYGQMGKYDSAISVGKRLVTFEEQGGDSLDVARALSALASTYIASGDPDAGLSNRIASLKKLSSSRVDSASHDVLKFKTQLLNQLASDYFLTNDQGKAIKTGQEGLALATQINARDEKRASLKTLAELYGLAGREDVQLQLIEQYILLNDSLQKEEMESRVAAENVKYSFAVNEKNLAKQKVSDRDASIDLLNKENSTRSKLMCGLIVLLLGTTIGSLLYARKRNRE